MVEDIEELRREFNLESFRDGETFKALTSFR